jgi:hypothetical protein
LNKRPNKRTEPCRMIEDSLDKLVMFHDALLIVTGDLRYDIVSFEKNSLAFMT